jgi:hypothetical protein
MYLLVYTYIYERGVPREALNLNSTSYPDHGRYADSFLQGKVPTAEPGIEPGTSWLEDRSSDHQAIRLVAINRGYNNQEKNVIEFLYHRSMTRDKLY